MLQEQHPRAAYIFEAEEVCIATGRLDSRRRRNAVAYASTQEPQYLPIPLNIFLFPSTVGLGS